MSIGYECDPGENVTLVLSHYWVPIGVTSAKDSIRKLYRESDKPRSKCTILALDKHYCMKNWSQWIESSRYDLFPNHPHLRASRDSFPVPTIILTTARWTYKTNTQPTVKYMYKRYKGHCQICGEKKPMEDMSIEHILPKSLHGTNDDFNLTLTCKPCNNKRGNIYPYLGHDGKPLEPPRPLPFLHIFGSARDEWDTLLVGKMGNKKP